MALLAGNLANKVIGFFIMLSVARFLGAEQFGLYTFVFAYVGFFGLVTDLGLTTVVARELSQDETTGRVWLGNAMGVRWIVSVVGYAVCVGASLLYHGRSETTSLVALAACTFFFAPLNTNSAIFTARLKLYGPSLISLMSRTLLLVAVQVLARRGAHVGTLIALEVALGGLTTVVLWSWAHHMLAPTYRVHFATIRRLLAEGIPLFMTSVFVALYFRIDVFFLEYYSGNDAVGSYAAAYRLTEAIPIAATAVTGSLFPVVCQLFHQGDSLVLEKVVRGSQKILLAMALPAALILVWHALPIVRVLYGGRFDSSAQALAILGCGQIFVYNNILLSTLLVASNRGRQLMLITLGMLCVNVVLNFLIIPIYGVPGAAVTTVLTEMAGTIALLFPTGTYRGLVNAIARLVAPACVFVIVLWLCSRVSPAIKLWSVLPALAGYALTIRGFSVFDQEEWSRLRKAVF